MQVKQPQETSQSLEVKETVWPPAPAGMVERSDLDAASREAKGEGTWRGVCGFAGGTLYQIGWAALFLFKVAPLLPAAPTGPNALNGIPDLLYFSVWVCVALAGLLVASVLRPYSTKAAKGFVGGTYLTGALMLFEVWLSHEPIS